MTDKTKPRTTVAQDVAALRAIADGAHASPETPAEVLAAHELPAMFRRAADGVRTSQAAVYEYCADQLERYLDAGKVATHAVFARSDEYPEPVCITGYAGTESEIARKVMEAARREGYRGTFADRMKELGWWIAPLYTAPPADPAKASELESWEVISMRHLADGLRARGDDLSTDAASWLEKFSGGDAAKASGSAPDGWSIQRVTDATLIVSPPEGGSYGVTEKDALLYALCNALLATPPASAPEVTEITEEMVTRLAYWMAKNDGHEDPNHLIWEGNPPEPWGEVWNRYEEPARAALTAALQQEGKSHG